MLGVPVSIQSPVLHRAGREVGQRYHVHLGQWKFDLEIILVVLEYPWSYVKTVARLLDGLATCPDSEVSGPQDLEVGDEKGDKVRRHWYRTLVVIPNVIWYSVSVK